MAPGPSSSPAPASATPAASTSRIPSAADEPGSTSGASSSRRPSRIRETLLSPEEDPGSDLKSCARCGQQLGREAVLPETAQRILSVGSHAIVLPPSSPDPQDDLDSAQVGRPIETPTDSEGRPLCQACSEAIEPSSREDAVVEERAMDTDEVAEAGPSEERIPSSSSAAAPPLSWQADEPMPPPSVSDDQPSSSQQGSSSVRSSPPPPLLSSSLPSLTSSTPLSISVAGGRRMSATSPVFTPRALPPQVVGSRGNDESESMSMGHIGSTADSMVAAASIGTSSSSSAASAALAAKRRTSRQSSEEQAIAPLANAVLDDGTGPSSMTRPRLSTLPTSAHRSQSPSASRQLSSHLRAPYPDSRRRSTTRGQSSRSTSSSIIPPATWFQPQRPDPMQDISRLRMPPRGRGCLYPGSIFCGTQKSGKLSYDVTVEILNIDLTRSHLDGYLNIRGLTEDWPELTTFFTAEVIGQDYSFHTGRWGATKTDDDKHWQRFGAYKSLKKMLGQEKWDGRPFNHLNKPFVFMRWKEHFLVPEHLVTDISGASFAGFYYVCAELGDVAEWQGGSIEPSTSQLGSRIGGSMGLADLASTLAPSIPSSLGATPAAVGRRRLGSNSSSPSTSRLGPLFAHHHHAASAWLHSREQMLASAEAAASMAREDSPSSSFSSSPRIASAANAIPLSVLAGTRRRRESGSPIRRPLDLPESIRTAESSQQTDPDDLEMTDATTEEGPKVEEGVTGRITAFYYHANSEPYQQLDLRHVEKRNSETFEFR